MNSWIKSVSVKGVTVPEAWLLLRALTVAFAMLAAWGRASLSNFEQAEPRTSDSPLTSVSFEMTSTQTSPGPATAMGTDPVADATRATADRR